MPPARTHAPENQRNYRLLARIKMGHTSGMISTFYRFIVVSLLVGSVAACASSAEQQAQRDDERCAARGLQPNSKEHDDCVTSLASQRDARMERRHREMVERPAPTYGSTHGGGGTIYGR
jgi:hypothetical protein